MHRRFAMVPAAVEIDDPAAVSAAVREAHFTPPTYLVGPETRRRFHAETADPPLHVLIDVGGRVLAMIRDNGSTSIGRMAEHARRRLDEVDPQGETRFASATTHRRATEAGAGFSREGEPPCEPAPPSGSDGASPSPSDPFRPGATLGMDRRDLPPPGPRCTLAESERM
jgi:hypothetical protein